MFVTVQGLSELLRIFKHAPKAVLIHRLLLYIRLFFICHDQLIALVLLRLVDLVKLEHFGSFLYDVRLLRQQDLDRKSTRLNSSHR